MKSSEVLEILEIEEKCAYNEYKDRCDKHCNDCKLHIRPDLRYEALETAIKASQMQ